MLTKREFEILGKMKEDLFRSYTFNELKNFLSESSNSKIQNSVKKFEDEGLISIERNKGFNKIEFNLNSPRLINYFEIIDKELINKKIESTLLKVKKVILDKENLFSIIVFGGYAKKNISKNSDLDILILVKDRKNIIGLSSEIESLKRKSLIEIDYHFFTIGEFLEMLKSKKENLGKQIMENFITFYGGEFFYNLRLKNGKTI